ncbi:MAG: EAL domain-containing protein [Hyphomicrobiaceae bacterium]
MNLNDVVTKERKAVLDTAGAAIACINAAVLGLGRQLALIGFVVLAILVSSIVNIHPANALDSIVVNPDADRIEITTLAEEFEGRGDSLQVETASGSSGVSGRMSVQAATAGTNPNWVVFALTNPSEQRIERWLTADRYSIVNSGVVWPDLDAQRIKALTPSVGFVPERIQSDRADVFRITVEPGQTVTFVAEKASDRYTRLYLWKPFAYELKVRERQLFNGAMLGLTGFLALFLTAIFAANHKAIFPSSALVACCVLAYLCVEFGLFHKVFNLRPDDNAVYRAAAEASMAASLVIFLHVFLRLGLSHGLWRMLITVWMMAQLSLVAVAVIDPRLSATFARLSFILIGGVGAVLSLYFAVRGQDRALSLLPTWLLFLVWIFTTAMVLTGRLSGDVAVAGVVAGLVLVVVVIGFTVTQYAFRAMEPMYGAAPNEQQARALAVDGASATPWEWNARRDEVKIGHLCEEALGLNDGELSTKVDDFSRHIHQGDRERFKMLLWSIKEGNGGRIKTDFRMRHTDNSYRWFELEASTVPSTDARNLRCVGLMRDVTEMKRAHERLLHDAVHDSLTGLPNRELFLDRLKVLVQRAEREDGCQPTVLFIDVDKFKSVNDMFGLVVGDSLLLTVARRLQKHLDEQDTLARVGGDQFAVLFHANKNAASLATFAEGMRTSLRAPIKIAGQEIVLTASFGLALWDKDVGAAEDLLKEAEVAMYKAKRSGADRIEIFHPSLRSERDERVVVESNLRKALERGQIKVLFQPIVYLPTEELAGFEALVRWEHPKLGTLGPDAFIPVAEESDLIVKLGSYVLMRAAHTAARWQKELPRAEHPLFVSVNISSRQLFRQDLIQEIRHIVGQAVVPPGALRLEITESLVMQNPEQATDMLEMLRAAGAELALDDFGTGYSSLAYLQRFPVNTIKIDRSLVQSSASGEEKGSAIVRSMVALAHELGKTVVAEGVERPDDVSFLRSIGCEYAQGFYYGEPMRDRDVIQLLRIVRKTERKLDGRNFFRTKSKKSGKSADKKSKEKIKSKVAKETKQAKDVAKPPRPDNSNIANGAGGAKIVPSPPPPATMVPTPQPRNSTPPHSPSGQRQGVSPPAQSAPLPNGWTPPPGVRVTGTPPSTIPTQPPQSSPVPDAKVANLGQPATGGANGFAPPPPATPASNANVTPPTQPGQKPRGATNVPSTNAGPPATAVPPPIPANGATTRPNNATPPPLAPTSPTTHQPPSVVGKGGPSIVNPVTHGAPLPDYSKLPPGIAASLERLAGSTQDEPKPSVTEQRKKKRG